MIICLNITITHIKEHSVIMCHEHKVPIVRIHLVKI